MIGGVGVSGRAQFKVGDIVRASEHGKQIYNGRDPFGDDTPRRNLEEGEVIEVEPTIMVRNLKTGATHGYQPASIEHVLVLQKDVEAAIASIMEVGK